MGKEKSELASGASVFCAIVRLYHPPTALHPLVFGMSLQPKPPSFSWNFPFSHTLQRLSPAELAGAYLPSLHSLHDLLPLLGWYLPGGHLVHLPPEPNLPSVHWLHLSEPASDVEPSGQKVH